MPDILPIKFRKRQGTATTSKGTLKGKNFHTWEIIPNCTANQGCPALSVCNYPKGDEYKCGVMKEYMTNITELIIKNYGDKLSEPDLYRVGMHLIPMYNMLCKVKIALSGVWNVSIVNSRGTTVVHPLMKEMREQIKSIERVWNSIGLGGIPEDKLPNVDMRDGNLYSGNYYEKMEKEALNERKRKVK